MFLLCTSCNQKGNWKAAAVNDQQTAVELAEVQKVKDQQPEQPQRQSQQQPAKPNFFGRAKNSLIGFFTGDNSTQPPKSHKSENIDQPKANAAGEKDFCEFANHPDRQNKASSEVLVQLVEWRTKMLSTGQTAQQCLNSCPNPTNAMKDFCHSLNWCQQNCTTSQIIKNCSTNTPVARDTLCVSNNCSPLPPPSAYYDANKIIKNTESSLPNIIGAANAEAPYSVAKRSSDLKITKEDIEIRKKIFLEITRKVIQDFETKTYTVIFADETSLPDSHIARYSELAKTYQERFFDVKKYLTQHPSPNSNYLQHMSETMLCINLPTNVGGENHHLEAVEQNNGCGNAFGLGQVISMTFYSNLGLNLTSYNFSTQNLEKKCKDSPLQYLATECGPHIFQSQFFRIELFDKYLAYTVDELFDRRAFDVELQVRLMFSTIINSFAMTQNWWGAFRSYRGNGTDYYAQFTPKNHSCMMTHMSSAYRPTDHIEL